LDYCEPLASVLSAQIAKMGVSCYQVFAGQDFITVLFRMILLETILAEKSAEALDSRTGRVQADAASMRNACEHSVFSYGASRLLGAVWDIGIRAAPLSNQRRRPDA
jgi:hypothetical protein